MARISHTHFNENPECFRASITVLPASVDQFARGRMAPRVSQSDPMNTGIDLTVPCARETMSRMIRRPHR
ncbi:hypothetical protein BDB13_5638 [Rhodococcus sp. OK302]|nr:hypothetical protein BDB13_5638 [Rhodococcus sp. OK302]